MGDGWFIKKKTFLVIFYIDNFKLTEKLQQRAQNSLTQIHRGLTFCPLALSVYIHFEPREKEMQTVGSPAPTPTPRGEFLCGFSKNKDVLSPTQDKYETQKPTLTLYNP